MSDVMTTEELHWPAGVATPSVDSDWQAGVLCMRGDSYPENSFEFFTPVLQWVERFLAETDRPLRLELHLVYLNTSSVKAMMDLFDMLEEAHAAGREVLVFWGYDQRNERVFNLAEEFQEDCSFPFQIQAEEGM